MNAPTPSLLKVPDRAVIHDRHAPLAKNAVLSMLSPSELDHVIGFATVSRYASGEIIFRKGDAADSMMLVAGGHVKIRSLGTDGREAVLAVFGSGDILGEMAILDSRPRSADAVAVSDTELMVIQRRDFIPYLERNPQLAVRMLALLCGRLRQTNEMVEDRMLIAFPARLAKALLRLAHLEGQTCEPGTRLDFAIPQRVFASLLGTSRETLNKQLHTWSNDGLIRLGRRSISIERPDVLQVIAEMK